jgi:hypothetical protein
MCLVSVPEKSKVLIPRTVPIGAGAGEEIGIDPELESTLDILVSSILLLLAADRAG